MVLEYVQTFGYLHKKSGDPDSGIERTKTKTGAPTIRSHLTEVTNISILASNMFSEHMVID